MVLRHDRKPRILYIDAYDSFSNNIVGLLEARLNAEVSIVRIDGDDAKHIFSRLERDYDAVVAGPGPGHPGNSADVGLISDLWKQHEDKIVPVLGICLGFQSFGLAFGARVERLEQPQHGIITPIDDCGDDIFADTRTFQAVQYHSLILGIGLMEHTPSGDTPVYECSADCPQLRPLAWQKRGPGKEPIPMAVRHIELPFWGVQFHPESISTDQECHKLLDNWWQSVQHWHATKNPADSSLATREITSLPDASSHSKQGSNIDSIYPNHEVGESRKLLWENIVCPGVSVVELAEQLKVSRSEVVMLDSQGHPDGRFSILGFIVPQRTLKVTYYGTSRSLHQETTGLSPQVHADVAQREVWDLLQTIADSHRPVSERDDLPSGCPFWGGFMGYISYEAGLDSISVERSSMGNDVERPDFNLAFVERSIVIDHVAGALFVQSLMRDDEPWIDQTTNIIRQLNVKQPASTDSTGSASLRQPLEELFLLEHLKQATVTKPCEEVYRKGVLDCQDALHAGDSYELCLTGETRVHLPSAVDSWSLYKRLRKQNAAPHGAFVRLQGATIISSSPERFLRWDREGKCQFRPIKGTVKKGADMTYQKAKAILSTSKEKAENLMIVDLIRHDLSGVIGAENVSVPQLMQVEEHATVYSLVSVIEGQIPRRVMQPFNEHRPAQKSRSASGIDVLKASLPPGSMTGAPKRRSCELLTQLERRPRGIYSGVLGYIDVGGCGDFSVVIRSAFQYDRQSAPPSSSLQVTTARISGSGRASSSSSSGFGWKTSTKTTPASSCEASSRSDHHAYDIWHIGAGGAVTVQSTDKGEYEEMDTKLNSVLKTFVP